VGNGIKNQTFWLYWLVHFFRINAKLKPLTFNLIRGTYDPFVGNDSNS
jgi:hypothetical protein